MPTKASHNIAVAVLSSIGIALVTQSAVAGPFILDGTDADEHGQATATTNQDGWLYIQRGLENLASAPSLTTPNRVVVALGSESTALAAVQSAFNFSSLPSLGWTFSSVPVLTQATFTSALAGAGIIHLDSGGNIGGGLTSAEEAVLTANAAAINTFVANGGGLFSHANDYGWLSALVPGLTALNVGDVGLQLTPAGTAAFPGLTNADLSAGPWHNAFGNVGTIPVLATGVGSFSGSPVIIGSAGGSITNPDPIVAVPAPIAGAGVPAVALLGLAGAWFVRRRNQEGFAA
jgi:hypothetical protein